MALRVFHMLQKAHAALFRAADRSLRETEGITTSQNTVLFVLSREDGLPISAIAHQLRMGKSSLTALIDRMIALGYVRRAPNPDDGRITNIFIEDSGREIVARTQGSVKDINERLLAPFTAAERETIDRFLTHIAQNAHEIVRPERDTPGGRPTRRKTEHPS